MFKKILLMVILITITCYGQNIRQDQVRALPDSLIEHRSYMNANRDSIKRHNDSINALSTRIMNITLPIDSINNEIDQLVADITQGLLIQEDFVTLIVVSRTGDTLRTITFNVGSVGSGGTDPAVDAALDSLRAFRNVTEVKDSSQDFYITDLRNRVKEIEIILSDTVTVTPVTPPQNLAGTGRDSAIFLTLEQPNPSLPDTFSVYRSTTPGNTNPTWIAKTTSLTYLNTGLLPGQIYYYKIRRIEYPDSSSFSNEATAQVLFPVLTRIPVSLDWGVQTVSANDSTKAFLIRNDGFGAARVSGITIQGTGASAFTSTGNTFPFTLAVGDTKSVFIKADFGIVGSYTASVLISYNYTPVATVLLGLTITSTPTAYNETADRYFSNVFGEDINSGLTPNDPLPLSDINTYLSSNVAQNIDTLRINAGETYILSSAILVNKSVNIFRYGTGNDPVLSGNNTLTNIFIVNADSFKLRNIEAKNINPIGGTSANNTNAIIYLSPSANYCTLDSLKLSNSLRTGNQWIGMIFGKDVHHITVTNSEFTGGITGINLMANYQNSHKDVHHIIYDNNKFYLMTDRAAVWFQQWFQTAPDVEGTPGSVLGAEGTYRDITITNNDFDSISVYAIYWYRDKHFYSGWSLSGVAQIERQGYNWNISDNNFNLIGGSAIELAPLSNRWGQNHPDGGVIGWSTIANNRIDSTGYLYATGEVSAILSCGIETHGWKQVYIEGNDITWTTSFNADGHGINLDFSPSFTNDIPCDSVVIRRNIIGFAVENGANSTDRSTAGIHFATMRKGNEIYDNIIYCCNYGIRHHAWSMNQPGKFNAVDNIITNNTIYDCDYGIVTTSGQSGLSIDATNRYVNNIAAYNINGWISASGSTTLTIPDVVKSNNLYFGNTADYNRVTAGTNDVLADPVFIDTTFSDGTRGNLDVLTGSFAINTGTDISLRIPVATSTFTDYLLRPKLSTRDIGAYEFQGSNPTSAPVVLSSNVTSIGQTTATLNATVTSGNLVTTAKFELRTDSTVAGPRYTVSPTSVSDFTPFYNLTGLTQATNYFYSTIATNSAGGDSLINNKRWYPFTTATTPTSFTDTLYILDLDDDYHFYDSIRSGTVSRGGETTDKRRSTYELYTNGKITPRNIIDAIRFEKTAKTTSSTAVTVKFNFDETPLPVMPLTETALLALDTTANVSLITFPQWTAGVKYSIVIPTAELQELVDDPDYSVNDPIGAIWFGETIMSTGFRDWSRRDDGLNYNIAIVTHHTP